MNVPISDESYEKLKIILEEQNNRTYTVEEVREIGNDLVELFEILASSDTLEET